MADGRHFENLKLPYIRNRLRYSDKILHYDAQRQSALYQKLKIRFFLNRRRRTAAILKKIKLQYYFRSCIGYRDEILFDDARHHAAPSQKLKI